MKFKKKFFKFVCFHTSCYSYRKAKIKRSLDPHVENKTRTVEHLKYTHPTQIFGHEMKIQSVVDFKMIYQRNFPQNHFQTKKFKHVIFFTLLLFHAYCWCDEHEAQLKKFTRKIIFWYKNTKTLVKKTRYHEKMNKWP